MRLTSPTTTVALLMVLAAAPARLAAQDDWTRIKPGETPEGLVQKVLGPASERLHVNGDGSWVVAYPIGKAVVDYSRTGAVTRLTGGPDAIQRAHTEALKTKASAGMSTLFGNKKKKP